MPISFGLHCACNIYREQTGKSWYNKLKTSLGQLLFLGQLLLRVALFGTFLHFQQFFSYIMIIKFNGLVWLMVFNATFNNISIISWQQVLLVEETGVPGENHRPVGSHWQTWSHNVVSSTPCHERVRTLNVSGDRHWLIAQVVVNPTTIPSQPWRSPDLMRKENLVSYLNISMISQPWVGRCMETLTQHAHSSTAVRVSHRIKIMHV